MKIILEAPSHREHEAYSSRNDQVIQVANKSSSNPHEEREKIQEAIVKVTTTASKFPQNIELSKSATKISRTSRIVEEEKVSNIQVKEQGREVGA